MCAVLVDGESSIAPEGLHKVCLSMLRLSPTAFTAWQCRPRRPLKPPASSPRHCMPVRTLRWRSLLPAVRDLLAPTKIAELGWKGGRVSPVVLRGLLITSALLLSMLGKESRVVRVARPGASSTRRVQT